MLKNYIPLALALFSIALSAELIYDLSIEFPELTGINHSSLEHAASSGNISFTPSGTISPKNETDVLAIIDFYLKVKKENNTIKPMVLSAGGRKQKGELSQGWSFDAHAQGDEGSVVLSTENLTGLSRDIDWQNDFDPKTGNLVVSLYSGTSWRDAINIINNSYKKEFNDTENYFVPIVAPTGGEISIGGSLASNSHARPSSVLGGYFADTVESFSLASVQNGHAVLIPVSRSLNHELFNTVIGSFGRGGIIVSIELKLQRVSAKKNVVTSIKRTKNMAELIKAMKEAQDRLRLRGLNAENKDELIPFLSVGGFVSSDFQHFFIFESDFLASTEKKAGLPLFQSPSCGSDIIHSLTRLFPKLSEKLMLSYLDWHASSGLCDFLARKKSGKQEAVFHNRPLDNYIFFQDGFTRVVKKHKKGAYKTGHITFIMPLENTELFMEVTKKLLSDPYYKDIHFELQDLLPIAQSSILMSPSYSKDSNKNISLNAYTLSWPINSKNYAASREFKIKLEKIVYQIKTNNKPLAWLHPLKEYSHLANHQFYKESAEEVEQILKSYNINDRIFLTNNIQESLYK
jgi:hypothetical protein